MFTFRASTAGIGAAGAAGDWAGLCGEFTKREEAAGAATETGLSEDMANDNVVDHTAVGAVAAPPVTAVAAAVSTAA